MIGCGRWSFSVFHVKLLGPHFFLLPLLRMNYINKCLNSCFSATALYIYICICLYIFCIVFFLQYIFIHLSMESSSSSFLLNPSTLQTVYYQAKEDHDGVIDLGLSLRTLQPEAYHPSGHFGSLEGYDELMEWPQSNLNLKSTNIIQPRNNNFQEDCEEDGEGIQSKERWAYVKVNMDGVIVGRKVCILDHGSYSSLALQLEDMFGRQLVSGLRLFQSGSEFSLFYKDRYENWRSVGDLPWKEFVERVKRLRIARKRTSGALLT